MPDLIRGGVTVHYEISGDGPPLLMLAGFMSDSASWAPLLPLLEPHFTLIRPDNRSTGRTTPWDAPCAPRLWAEDAVAVLDTLGYAKALVLGHSLGGLIGWQLAATMPDRAHGLIMAGSAPRQFERNTALFRALIDVRRSDAPEGTWLRLLFPWLFAAELYDTPEVIEAAVAQSLAYPFAQSVEAMEHQLNSFYNEIDPTPFLSPPSVPLLAVLAEKDLLVPLDLARASLSGIATESIADAGHSIHWDAPDRMAEIVLKFAKGLG